jgi:hypothetical protein
MDVDSLYKKAKAENNALLTREKELLKRLEDVKRLMKQSQERKARIGRLEAELSKHLQELDD